MPVKGNMSSSAHGDTSWDPMSARLAHPLRKSISMPGENGERHSFRFSPLKNLHRFEFEVTKKAESEIAALKLLRSWAEKNN